VVSAKTLTGEEYTMPASVPVSLAEYDAKRDFQRTPEPGPEKRAPRHRRPIFVVQEHHASRLHYDFRLESEGVLKSWAVPKEPSMNPADKRLAVHVEDHPISYATFKGTIPKGSYGAGKVFIWDHGTYEPLGGEEAFIRGMEAGKVEFDLDGKKLKGRFALVRMQGRGKDNWLLIKMRDQYATRSTNGQPATESRPAGGARSTRPSSPPEPRGSEASPSKVEVTNGDKVWFPLDGITKRDVFDYYAAVADRVLPFLRDRPMTLERLPDGIEPGKPHFWQKHTPEHYPRWIPRVELPTERGHTVQYVLVNDKAALLYLVNQGTLTFHPWLSRVDDPDRPDFVLFDLDPGSASFSDAVAMAKELRRLLDQEGVASVPKTSGKTGLHVLVTWQREGGYDEAREWARSVATRVAEAMPERATVEIRKGKRGQRVYIDTLQNARGHHAVPPYVVRPVAGAPVSMPLEWDELTARLRPGQFTLRTAMRRLTRQKSDPIADLLRSFRRKG
jgi:bifunctional non-homologous end joining protein LigD